VILGVTIFFCREAFGAGTVCWTRWGRRRDFVRWFLAGKGRYKIMVSILSIPCWQQKQTSKTDISKVAAYGISIPDSNNGLISLYHIQIMALYLLSIISAMENIIRDALLQTERRKHVTKRDISRAYHTIRGH